MKKKSINILITALLLLGIVAVVLFVFLAYADEVFDDNLRVSENGVTTHIMEVRNLRLNPAESREYTVNLICEASGGYRVFLDYEEIKDGGMKDFVNVTVKCNGSTVYEGPLKELLDTDKVVEFFATLEADDPVPISVKYKMPYETGNEAQETYSDFNVKLTIKKSDK